MFRREGLLLFGCKLFSCHHLVPDTEDASETDLAKHEEDDYVEIKEQWVFVDCGSAVLTLMKRCWEFLKFCGFSSAFLCCCRMYQDKLASLKRQLLQLQEGNPLFVCQESTASLHLAGWDLSDHWLVFIFIRDSLVVLWQYHENSKAKVMILCIFIWGVLHSLFAGTLQEYQKRMKKLDQQYKERLRNAGKYWETNHTVLRFRCIQNISTIWENFNFFPRCQWRTMLILYAANKPLADGK